MLESELDGVELLARPNIELVTVGPQAIREAELRIAGCERCRPEADHLFDSIQGNNPTRVNAAHGVFAKTTVTKVMARGTPSARAARSRP